MTTKASLVVLLDWSGSMVKTGSSDTPLAEEGMTGVAIGAALNGLYPIQTHIRMDFALVAMNQLINHAAKYRYMFGGNFEVPMLIRMVIGRSWGQGAQHSQSLQSLFGHIPGLTVIMPSNSQSVLECYPYAISRFRGPVISLEHRLLYDLKFHVDGVNERADGVPWTSKVIRSGRILPLLPPLLWFWRHCGQQSTFQKKGVLNVK